jgi:DNA repair photolyase
MVTRTFDTPGFAGMTFYEVRAKSIINRVPSTSRVPFQWTINPYRGCSHACTYCAWGGTPILMGDGRTKPLAEVRVGDTIYGTIQDGRYRRYTTTRVLAHWSTVKPAYRVTLEDGTELITSGEHRFLTDRGWKHVTSEALTPRAHGDVLAHDCGAHKLTPHAHGDVLAHDCGAHKLTPHAHGDRRPHLTVGSRLMGPGGFPEPAEDTPDYRRGYLCGVIRGDGGGLGSYEHRPADEASQRLTAAVDGEALERTRQYLAAFGMATDEFPLQRAVAGRQPAHAIRAHARVTGHAIEELTRWPDAPAAAWHKGFLAGVFDADGSFSRGIFRIACLDPAVTDRTIRAMRQLGFDVVVEQTRQLRHIRLSGGLRERLRFFLMTDPATTRKRSIDGMAIRSDPPLGVVSIEPLGMELPLFDITTGTGDFIANGVVSHNCFARNTHTYLDLDAGRDFDTRVIVKVNAGELVRRELAAPRWSGDPIAMGTNVDCYQRAEGRYRLMPQIIAALRDFTNPFSILTKGTLILRDLPLLRQAAEVTDVSIAFSVGFVDEDLWRTVESGTPSPRRRLDAVRALTDAGFRVGVLMAPILPELTDTDESIEATVAAIARSGAASVTPLPLHLRTGAREWYLSWLSKTFPALLPRYLGLFRRGSYSPDDYQREVVARVRMAARRHGVGAGAPSQTRQAPLAEAQQPGHPKPPPPEQLTLL